MMLNLPDALVQHAKSYADQHGTTMTALIRDNLERLTGYQPEPLQSDDPLVAFSQGRISRQETIRALGLRDYAQLLLALGEKGLSLPYLPGHEVEAMADTLIRVVEQSRR